MTDINLERSPYQRFLGVRLVRADKGYVEIHLPFKAEFLRTDGSDWYHGGIVSALADIAGAHAVVTAAGDKSGATIDLRVDWLRPARQGDLYAVGRTVKTGRRICVADVEVRDANNEVVALARGTFAGPGN